MIRGTRSRIWSICLAVALFATLGGFNGSQANAFGHHRNGNFFQRHPTLTALGAGYGAYHLSKTTGRRRAMRGGRGNFAQRHPLLTGIGAGLIAHHYAKKRSRSY